MSQGDKKLDEFLDRVLGTEDMLSYKKEVAADPELRREAELQRWIDDELNAEYAYDSSRAPVFPAMEAEAPAPIPITTRPRFFKPLAMAAAIALAGLGIWAAMQWSRPGGNQFFVSPDTVYTKLVSRGFTPDFVCTTDDEFKAATKKRLGTPLLLASASNTQVLGWAYNAGFRGKIVGSNTMMLLTRVDSKEVLILMDDAKADRKLEVPAGSGLHLYRHQVGPIVTYEISPFDSVRVADKLKVAE